MIDVYLAVPREGEICTVELMLLLATPNSATEGTRSTLEKNGWNGSCTVKKKESGSTAAACCRNLSLGVRRKEAPNMGRTRPNDPFLCCCQADKCLLVGNSRPSPVTSTGFWLFEANAHSSWENSIDVWSCKMMRKFENLTHPFYTI